jgi:beta-alanine degradation protein BauB
VLARIVARGMIPSGFAWLGWDVTIQPFRPYKKGRQGQGNAADQRVGTSLMFENERVRVWDLDLAPGESLEKHIYRTDCFYIVESAVLIRSTDPDNPDDFFDLQFTEGEVVFIPVAAGGKIDNRLTNIGEKHHRNYVIELKRGGS